jgi:hypothetical protein
MHKQGRESMDRQSIGQRSLQLIYVKFTGGLPLATGPPGRIRSCRADARHLHLIALCRQTSGDGQRRRPMRQEQGGLVGLLVAKARSGPAAADSNFTLLTPEWRHGARSPDVQAVLRCEVELVAVLTSQARYQASTLQTTPLTRYSPGQRIAVTYELLHELVSMLLHELVSKLLHEPLSKLTDEPLSRLLDEQLS